MRWFLATPDQQTKQHQYNPLWKQLDHSRIGMAGHSAGGVAVSRLGQEGTHLLVRWRICKTLLIPYQNGADLEEEDEKTLHLR